MDYVITLGEGGAEELRVTVSGTASLEGMRAYTEALLADPRFRPGMSVLFDHRTVDWSSVSAGVIRRRADDWARYSERAGPSVVAAAVGTEVNFGLFRMLQTLADERHEFEYRVFRSVEEAQAWLRERRRPTREL